MQLTAQERTPMADPLRARIAALEAENAALRQRLALLESAGATETAALMETRLHAEISHALRQPLAALALYASVLKNHVAPAGQPLLAHVKTCLSTLSELLAK